MERVINMQGELQQIEQALLRNPFDQSLRENYAEKLLAASNYAMSIEQWTLLLQQDANNAHYQEKLELTKNKLLESQIPAEGDKKFKVIDSNYIPPQHNIINLARADKIRFIDIAGMAEIKKVIKRRIIDPFINPSLFDRFKRKAGGGVLLYGPPGCGKTMMAKAIATECKASFQTVGISDILNMYIGASESNLANVFEQARNNTPAVLFFDELDALAYSRSKATNDHTRTLVNEFLSQLDGLTGQNDKVLVLGATNMPWDIDDAMKRPGRFDRQIFVPPPDEIALREMLRIKLREVPCDTIDFDKIARQCNRLSGADVDGLIELAKDHVLDDIMDNGNERQLNESDLLRAVEEIEPSTIEWLQTARNLVKYANASASYKDVAIYLKSCGMY
jgi:transitional endoplasmic reticulum ATPase